VTLAWRHRIPFAVVLIAIAFLVRLGVLIYLFDPAVKFDKFLQLAHDFLNLPGREFGAFSNSPFYIGYVSAMVAPFGQGITGQGLILFGQVLCGTATVWLVYRLALEVCDEPWVARCAGIITALFEPFILHEMSFLAASFSCLFTAATLLLLLVSMRTKRRDWIFAAGVAMGLLIIVRPAHLLALVALGVLIVWQRWDRPGRRWGGAIAYGLGALLVILPVTAINYHNSGQFVLVTSSGGFVFYSSNNYAAQGLRYWPPPIIGELEHDAVAASAGSFKSRVDNQLSIDIARRVTGQPMNATQVSRFYYDEALAFIRDHPDRFALLLARKMLALFHGYAFHDTEAAVHAQRLSRVPLVRYGWVLVLAAVALPAALKRRGVGDKVLLVFMLSQVLFFLGFYVLSRFRLPMAIPLIIYAAMTVQTSIDQFRQRRYARLAGAAIAVVSLTVVVHWPWIFVRRTAMETHQWAATVLQDNEDAEGVARFHRLAIDVLPQHPLARKSHRFLARHHEQRGEDDAAARHAELSRGHQAEETAGVTLAQAHAQAQYWRSAYLLGMLAGEQSRWDEAVGHYQQMTASRPDMPHGHYVLGLALFELEQYREARTSLEQSLRLGMKFTEGAWQAHFRLAVIASMDDRLEASAEHLEACTRLQPDFDQAWVGLLHLYAQLGREDKVRQVHDRVPAHLRERVLGQP